MTNRDFTIDMRMQADFARATREVENTQAVLDRMGIAGSDAGKAVEALGQSVNQAAGTMSGYTKAAVATQQAVQQEIALIGQLQARLAAGASTWQELADSEAMLDKAMAKGLVTAEEYDEALVSLDKSHATLTKSTATQQKSLDGTVSRYDKVSAKLAKLEVDEKALRAAVESGRISREQYNRAMADVSSQRAALANLGQQEKAVRRLAVSQAELRTGVSTAASQALRGDFTGAGTSLLGLTTKGAAGFGVLSAAIAGGTAVLGAFLTAAYQGEEQLSDFQKALLSAGGSAGVTSGDLQVMADQLGEADGRFADAEKSLRALAASGAISRQSLRTAAQAALDLSQLTGDSIEQTTQKVIALAKSPTKTLKELNDQYRFLTVEVYEHVRSLEEQGRTTDAATAALEHFAEVHQQRVQQAQQQAGYLERAWTKVKTAVLGAWQFMKSIGSNDVSLQMANLQKDLEVSLWASDGQETDRVKKLRGEIAKLQGQLQDVQDLAAGTAFASDLRQQAVDAAQQTADALEKSKSKADQLADAVDKVRKRYILLRDSAEASNRDDPLLADVVFKSDGSISGGGYAQEVAALKKQYAEPSKKRPKSAEQKADDAAKQELQDLARKVVLLGQVAEGETKASEASRIGFEIESGKYKSAGESIKSQLLDAAQLYDSQKLIRDTEKDMAGWQAQINKLRGLSSPPELDEATRQLKAQQAALESIGHTGEAAKIGELLGLQDASRQLVDLRQQYDQVMGQIGLQVQTIQAEQQAGLITQAGAQQKIVDLYQSQLGTLTQLVPKMRSAAEALGDPEALANVAQIELKLKEMASTTNLLQQSISNGFESGITNGLNALAEGTGTLTEAVNSFFLSISKGIVNYFAQDWAQRAAGWLSGLMGKLGNGSMEATAAIAAASITTGAATTSAATTTAAASVAASTLSGGVAAAAVSLVQAAITAAQILAAASATSSAAGVVTVGAATALATGGEVNGPGTGTSDSVPAWLSAGEFVTRAAVMNQPGALRFMYDFNRRGMGAVRRWGRYAQGGQVGALKRISSDIPDNASAMQRGQAKNMRLYLLQDQDELVQRLASHPAFEQAVVLTAGRNGGAIQAEW